VATAGHFQRVRGAEAFAETHPDLLRAARAVFTLEGLAAKEVKEGLDGDYAETGRPQATTLNVPPVAAMVARVLSALERKPTRATVVMPAELGTPLSDAAGFVGWSRRFDAGYRRPGGLPYVSWTSDPLYRLDDADTPDRLDRARLVPVARTVTELVKAFCGP